MPAYLDHAASTPMLPEALAAYVEAAGQAGNASSLHAAGRRARRVVEEARESIAADLGARPGEVVLTSGGTESDNLAVKGLFWSRTAAEPGRRRVLASAVEHHAVLDPLRWLEEREGAVVEWLPVDPSGRVPVAAVEEAFAAGGDDVALCTLMWANNEVGTVQPVAQAAALAAAHGVPFHSDAVQAVGQLPVDVAAAGVAALSVSSHKIGGPFGVGALVVDRGLSPTPLLHGGGQERDVRSGTLDVPAAAGFAVALHHAVAEREARAVELARLRDRLAEGVLAAVPGAVVNGDRERRLPGNLHVSFPGCEGDALLMLLDAAGVECSTGSACTAGIPRPSHVLVAMGVPDDVARGSLRFSLGRTSTDADVDAVLAALPAAVDRASRAGALRRTAGV